MRDRSTGGGWGRRVQIASVVLFVVSGLIMALPADAARAKCFGRIATIVGTNGDDELIGTRGSDVIAARGGIDFIDGREGRDLICAGSGEADFVFAGPGHDRIAGGRGFDVIFPGPGNDFVDGGPGEDLVTYEGTSVPVLADLSKGVLFAQGRDRLKNVEGVGGGEADDVLIGDENNNGLLGCGGNDTLVGRGGDDFINVGAGDDVARGGEGEDVLDFLTAFCGPAIGDDTLATSGVVVDLAAGTAVGGADVGEDIFRGFEITGATLGDDTIRGDDTPFNLLIGFAGNDVIEGRGGDDVISPGPGDDTADGGDGVDAVDYFLSDALDFGGLGPVTVDLPAQTATGIGNDSLVSIEGALGTLLNDTLIGDAGDNFPLVGDEGDDTISGGPGDDFLDGDAFFFGVPFELPGDDTLDGGPGQDVCLGGQTVTECEILEPAGPQSRAATRVAALQRHAQARGAAVRSYRALQSYH